MGIEIPCQPRFRFARLAQYATCIQICEFACIDRDLAQGDTRVHRRDNDRGAKNEARLQLRQTSLADRIDASDIR